MDKAELPIELVSLFFQVFAGCLQGYELIADACRLKEDAQVFLVKLKNQQYRLIHWGKVVQLDLTDEKLLLNPMSKGTIVDILDQQQQLLASFGRPNHRYAKLRKPLLQEQNEAFVIHSDSLLENGGSMSEESKKCVQFPPAEELVIKALNWLERSTGVPKRIELASWDHKRMDGLISKLSDFNDKMHEALDKAQMEMICCMQIRFHFQIILLNRQMQNLVRIWQSDPTTHQPQSPITDSQDSEHDFTNNIVLYETGQLTHHLGALAQQKFVHLAIENPLVINEEYGNSIDLQHIADIRGTELLMDNISPKDNTLFSEDRDDIDTEQRTEAIYDDIPVWIEWKANEIAGPGQQDGDVDPKIQSRVQELAAKLKQDNHKVNFCAPHCLGYIIDKSEDYYTTLGLVFKKPANVPHDTPPTTLRTCIKEVQAGRSDIPSLTDRITLMLRLAETVERLHAVDWLHKGLRSANILFFQSEQTLSGNLEVDYANPYVSGFDYSLPAMNDDLTERPTNNPRADIYRHPHVQSTGNREESSERESYMKSFDIYSLGIVLLEIAYWKTIDQILGVDLETARPKQTWSARERLLKEKSHLRGVSSAVGNTVEGVIRACLEGPEAFVLRGECDERSGIVAAAVQRGFWELVVRKLGGIAGL